MTNYNKQLLLKEAAKVGSLHADTPLPKMPGWSPNHIRSGRDWMGRSPLLEKYLDSYLQRRNIYVDKHCEFKRRDYFEGFSFWN